MDEDGADVDMDADEEASGEAVAGEPVMNGNEHAEEELKVDDASDDQVNDGIQNEEGARHPSDDEDAGKDEDCESSS